MASTSNYVPGVCNINQEEIAYRKKAGYFGLGLTIVVGVVLFALPVTRYARLLLFVPAFIAAIGYLQARNKFCVAYGAAGKQHADDGGTAQMVAEAAAKLDKQKARKMNLQAAAISVLVVVIAILV